MRFDPIQNPHQLRRIFLMSAALYFSKGAKKGGFPGSSVVKNLSAMQETRI